MNRIPISESFAHTDHRGVPLDHKLLDHLAFRDGFFVEAGANDGVTQSNTVLLERFLGWRGLLVEPSPGAFERCKSSRSRGNIYEQCALVADSGRTPYVKGDFDDNLMSSVDGAKLRRPSVTRTVPGCTLSELVKRHGIERIDFMSLDVEGCELEVLRGVDFSHPSRPSLFLIEVYEEERRPLFELLELNDYEFAGNLSGYNHLDNPGWDGTHNDLLFRAR